MDGISFFVIIGIGYIIVKNFRSTNNSEQNYESSQKEITQKGPTQRGATQTKMERLARNKQNVAAHVVRKYAAKALKPETDFKGRNSDNIDENRHRRDDWGQRSAGEIISTQNLLIVLSAVFIVLYVLSRLSPDQLTLNPLSSGQLFFI